MATIISSAAFLEKNKLANDGAWILLLVITLPDSTVFRICRNTEDIVWPASGGDTYQAFPFEIDEIKDTNSGEVPLFNIKVSNISGAIEPYLQTNKGGVGSSVELMIVHEDHLDLTTPELDLFYKVLGTKTNRSWITFSVGADNPYRRNFPANIIRKNFCSHRTFKGTRCGYAGAVTTCDRSLTTCRSLGNSTRFGGAPGVGNNGLYI